MTAIRVLCLEDNPADVALMLRQLRKDDFEPICQRVETRDDFERALHAGLDLILADYTLPQFDAASALQMLLGRQIDVPFIVVSGTISEEVAVDCMKRGAADYILKDRIARLGQAVRQALAAKKARGEQRRAEEAIREYETSFRLFAERAQDIVFRYRLRPRPRLEFVSPAIARVTGYSQEEFCSDLGLARRVVFPEDKLVFEKLILGGGFEQPVTLRVRHKNGSTVWLETQLVALRDEAGEPVGMEGVARDVSERVLYVQALQTSEEKYRTLVEAIDDPVVVKDAAGRYTMVNDAAARMHHRAKEDFVGKSPLDLFNPNAARMAMEEDRRILAEGVTIEAETGHLRPAGRRVYHRRKVPLRDAAGRVVGVVSISRDITKLKLAESALRESEERYRNLVEIAHDGILVHVDGRYVFANPAALRLYGAARREDVVGKPFADFVHPDYGGEAVRRLAQLQAGPTSVPVVESKRLRLDGTEVDVEVAMDRLTYEGKPAVLVIMRDITERKKAERARQESEAKYRNFVESSDEGIVLTDELGLVTEWNKAQELITGLSRAEVLGKPIWDVQFGLAPKEKSTPTTYKYTKAVALRLLGGEQLGDIGGVAEIEIERADGSRRVVQPLLSVLSTDRGYLLANTVRDVTERKRAEEAQARLAAIVESSQDAIIGTALDGSITSWNRAAEQLYGYTAAEVIGQSITIISPPQAGDEMAPLLGQVTSGEHVAAYDTVRRRKDGGLVAVSVSISPVVDDTGRIIGTAGVARDITARQRAEAALRESEERYRTLVESAQEGIMVHVDDRVVFANQAALGIYGASRPEDLLGRNRYDFVPPAFRALAEERAADLRAGSPSLPLMETKRLRLDGTLVDIEVSAVPAVYQGKSATQAMLRDISGRKRAEEALRRSEARFRAVFNSAASAILLADLEGRLVDANPAFERITGFGGEEFKGVALAALVHPEDRPAARDHFRSIGRGVRHQGPVQWRGVHRDGQLIWVSLILSLICREDGEPEYVLALCENITERKQMEVHLQRAQRLEIAGRLAAQVAHDFNNLLVPIAGLPELIRLRLPEGDPGRRMCDIVLSAAQSMAKINDNMLALGRRGHAERRPTDLNKVVQQAVEQISSPPSGLSVRLDLAADLPSVLGASAQLLRVVNNLVANARDAMKDEGQLYVDTTLCHVCGQQGRYGYIAEGDYVKLTVRDSGPGIPARIQDSIFEAFFTTKRTDEQRGSGLGLTVVQAVVNDHSGHVDLETGEGRGTSFHIYLPVCSQRAAETSAPSMRGGSESILVVDDDYFQRVVAVQMLQTLGYKVAAVSSGEEALERLRTEPADLIVLDMNMPGGNDGAETYRRILAIQPGQKAIIVSGYAESTRVSKAQQMGAGAFYHKPMTTEWLAHAVRTELERTS